MKGAKPENTLKAESNKPMMDALQIHVVVHFTA